MPTTPLGLRYPSSTSAVQVSTDFQNLATDTDNHISKIVASWKTTPALLTVTTEVDVLSNSWTPPIVGCYEIKATVPFDGSASGTDVKARIRVGGTEIDYDLRPTPGGVFVGKLRLSATIDIASLTPVTVKTTIERTNGAATLNCRLVEARTEIFLCGATGVRA